MAKRTTKKKTTRKTGRKTTARKKTTRKKAAVKKTRRMTGSRKPRTKSEIFGTIAEEVGITKREVADVFDVMQTMIAADLKKGSAGSFNVPGMMKVTVRRKPATRARKGVNPFTGEEMMFKAKPARNVVKIRPLKALKDMV